MSCSSLFHGGKGCEAFTPLPSVHLLEDFPASPQRCLKFLSGCTGFSVLWMPPRQPHLTRCSLRESSLGCSLSVSSHTYLYLHAIYRSANLKRKRRLTGKMTQKGVKTGVERRGRPDDQKPGSSELSSHKALVEDQWV